MKKEINLLKSTSLAFIMTAGFFSSSVFAQGSGGPVPPNCLPQYTVINNNICGNADIISKTLNTSCQVSTQDFLFKYLSGSNPVLRAEVVTLPNASNGQKTTVRLKKCDGTALSSAGRAWVHDPMGYYYGCKNFASGSTFVDIEIPALNYSAGQDTQFRVLLESTTDAQRFTSQTFAINFNAKPCKTYPQQNQQDVPIVGVNLVWNALITPVPASWKYRVYWRKKGTANYTEEPFIVGANNNSFSLPTLEYNTEYEYNVVSFFGSVPTPHLAETFTFRTMQDPTPPPPPPCYPEVQNREHWNWNDTLATYNIMQCGHLYDRVDNIDDPSWVTEVNFDASTQNVEIKMKPNKTLNYRYASFRFWTTEGRGFTWQVVQKPMEFADIIIKRVDTTTICDNITIQQIETNLTELTNDYFITVVAVTEEEPNGIVVVTDYAGNMLANGFQLELPANSQRFSNVKKLRFILQANYGGFAGGSYLQVSEDDYFFAGVPHPVLSHQTTLEACENGTYQCRFLSANNSGNYKYAVYDSKGDLLDEISEYFTFPVGTAPIDLVVKVIDKDCNKFSDAYNFTITPISKPNVSIASNTNQSIVNQLITVTLTANQAQYVNTPPMIFVSINNGAYLELQIPVINNSFVYTPTVIGTYTFRTSYRGNLGCWGEAISDEITVENAVVSTSDVYVSAATGNDLTGNGTLQSPYKTIGKGLSIITTGAALHFAGHFNEEATITKNISLIGDGEDTSSIGILRIVSGQEVSILGNFGITNRLEVENGALVSNMGNSIWLKSDATKTATARIEGTITDAIAAERYFTTPFSGALFGSPMAEQAFADLPFATQPKEFKENVVTTSLNNGYLTTADIMAAVGKGYRVVYMAGTQKVIVWGNPNNDPSYSQIISRTHTGFASAGGYNLVSNMYFMPLDFDSINQSNLGQINGIAYFFEATSPTAGVFKTYNSITKVSVGGASKAIPTFQAFFVRRTVVGTANFTIGKNNWLLNGNNTQYFRAENLAKPQMDLLRMQAKSGNDSSDVVVHTWQGAGKAYDAGIDQELPNQEGFEAANLLYMPEKKSGENLLVNALDKLEGAFDLVISSTGKIVLRVTERLGSNTKVALFDKQTGQTIDLSFGNSHEIENLGNKDRFILLIGDVVDSYLVDREVLIYPNPTKDEITVSSNHFKVNSLEVIDMLGRTLLTTQQSILSVKTLNTGSYILRIKSTTGEVITKKFIKE